MSDLQSLDSGEIYNPQAYASAVKRNIIWNAMKTWRKNTPRHEEIEDALNVGRTYMNGSYAAHYADSFVGKMALAFDTWGKLSEKQCAAILKGIDARAARKLQWAAEAAELNARRDVLGTVGEKLTIKLTCVKIITIERPQLFYGDSGMTFMHICEDDARNVIMYKGTANGFPREGETKTITATVKEHAMYKGTPQTIIQRPRIAKEQL